MKKDTNSIKWDFRKFPWNSLVPNIGWLYGKTSREILFIIQREWERLSSFKDLYAQWGIHTSKHIWYSTGCKVLCVCVCVCVCVRTRAKLLQLCLTFCHPMDCSLQSSSVQGILQARVLEWVAMPSSRGSSWSRDWIQVCYISCTGRWVLYC